MGISTSLFHIFLVAGLFALSIASARADEGGGTSGKAGFFGLESRRIGITYTGFGGDKYNSLSGGQGYGLGVSLYRGNSFIGLTFGLNIDYSKGNVPFMDRSTAMNLDYTLLAATMGFGLRINPVIGHGGVGIYAGAGLLVGMNQLSLPDRTYNVLNKSESAASFGYDIYGGIELGSEKSRRFFLEAGLKSSKASLAGVSNFMIEGFYLQGGIAW